MVFEDIFWGHTENGRQKTLENTQIICQWHMCIFSKSIYSLFTLWRWSPSAATQSIKFSQLFTTIEIEETGDQSISSHKISIVRSLFTLRLLWWYFVLRPHMPREAFLHKIYGVWLRSQAIYSVEKRWGWADYWSKISEVERFILPS